MNPFLVSQLHICNSGIKINGVCVHMLCTVKPVLSDHAWAKKKWSLKRGGLLIEVVKTQLGHD